MGQVNTEVPNPSEFANAAEELGDILAAKKKRKQAIQAVHAFLGRILGESEEDFYRRNSRQRRASLKAAFVEAGVLRIHEPQRAVYKALVKLREALGRVDWSPSQCTRALPPCRALGKPRTDWGLAAD